MNWFKKIIPKANKSLDEGLKKTKDSFFSRINLAILGKSKIDEEVLDQLEESLISSDVGVNTSLRIIEKIQDRVAKEKYIHTKELKSILREEVIGLMAKEKKETVNLYTGKKPYVIMVVGVNGAGKTTTIGKLAYNFKKKGLKVMIGAADTFRAAASQQLDVWAKRVDVSIVKQSSGANPTSIVFDTLKSAQSKNIDIVLIDTAGRLHNNIQLMNELSSIKRVMNKVIPDSPDEVMLVLDGSTGQNAFEQARKFTAATQVTSLTITKLDGTAKGGVLIGISNEFDIPVRYIGLGEALEDLQEFDAQNFVDSLFKTHDL